MFNLIKQYKVILLVLSIGIILFISITLNFNKSYISSMIQFVRNGINQREQEIIKNLTIEKNNFEIKYSQSQKNLDSLEKDKIILLKNYTIIHQRLNIINKSIDDLKNKPKEKLPEGLENVIKTFKDMGYSVSIMDCK